MTTLNDLFVDVDEAYDALSSTPSSESSQRRNVRAVLGALYEIRAVLEYEYQGKQPDYHAIVATESDGQIAEGVIVARGQLAHHARNNILPMFERLLPGPTTFPGPNTFPGLSITWKQLTEMDSAGRTSFAKWDKATQYYQTHVAGRSVYSTIDTARQFFRKLAAAI